jgi:hypothetical protein
MSERRAELVGRFVSVRSVDNVIAMWPEKPPRHEPEPLWREAVGEQLRSERAERGERIVDVSGRAGLAPQYLSELERGLKDPSSEVLSAVAGALDLSVFELTRRAGLRLSEARPEAPRGPVCLAA